jgi:hypothetical protein
MSWLKPIILGGMGWEDCSSKPALAKYSSDPYLSQEKLDTCHPSYMESINWKITFRAGLGYKWVTLSQKSQHKKS